MRKIAFSLVFAAGALSLANVALASSVSEREYKRGYNDCLRGDYDQNQHGSSYKRGCRAAEDSGQSSGEALQPQADAGMMKNICHGGVIGRFNPHARSVRIDNVQPQRKSGWDVFGTVVLDDGSVANFVCMFSANGKIKRINASEPVGAINEMDHEGFCPPDVSEANRYKYPACN